MWGTETKEGIVVPIDIAPTLMTVGWTHDENSEPVDAKGIEFYRSIVMSHSRLIVVQICYLRQIYDLRVAQRILGYV